MKKPGSIRSQLFYHMIKSQNLRGKFSKYLKDGIDSMAADRPAKSQLSGIEHREQSLSGRSVHILGRQQNPTGTNVVFFHGGGYLFQASSFHWEFIADLVRRTGVTIHSVDYPLSPDFHSGAAYDFSMQYYQHLLGTMDNDSLLVMGDSAGAGLALALLNGLKRTEQPMPRKGILLSPFLDATFSDPRQKQLDEVDPILSMADLKESVKAYAGSLSVADWRVSPINDPLDGLCPISIYTSDYDLLHTDALRLKDKLTSIGRAPVFYFEPGMVHDWMIFNMLPEAKKAREHIAAELMS